MYNLAMIDKIVIASITFMGTLSLVLAVSKPDTRHILLAGIFGNFSFLLGYLWIFSNETLIHWPNIFMGYIPATISLATFIYLLVTILVVDRKLNISDIIVLIPAGLSWIGFAGFGFIHSETKQFFILQLYAGNHTIWFLPFTVTTASVAMFFLIRIYQIDPEYYSFQFRNRKGLTGIGLLVAIGIIGALSLSTISVSIAIQVARYSVITFSVLAILGMCIHIRYPHYFLSWIIDFKSHYQKRNYLGKVDVTELTKSLIHAMTIKKRYRDNELTLDSLSLDLGVTRYQLSQLINTTLDTTFSRYIQGFRVSDASELLLRHPDRTILSIAYEVGFNSNSVFQTAFRAIHGISPSEYRQKNK